MNEIRSTAHPRLSSPPSWLRSASITSPPSPESVQTPSCVPFSIRLLRTYRFVNHRWIYVSEKSWLPFPFFLLSPAHYIDLWSLISRENHLSPSEKSLIPFRRFLRRRFHCLCSSFFPPFDSLWLYSSWVWEKKVAFHNQHFLSFFSLAFYTVLMFTAQVNIIYENGYPSSDRTSRPFETSHLLICCHFFSQQETRLSSLSSTPRHITIDIFQFFLFPHLMTGFPWT